jgi:ABC-type multidrug transport system fused ATPase/permease subunit
MLYIFVIAFFICYTVILFETKYFIAYLHRVHFNCELFISSFILTIDPVYHSSKSSGKVYSNMRRYVDSVTQIIDQIDSELVPFVILNFTSAMILFSINLTYGALGLLFLILLTLFSTYLRINATKLFQELRNQRQDSSTAVIIETAHNANFIRSTFSTPETKDRLEKEINKPPRSKQRGIFFRTT